MFAVDVPKQSILHFAYSMSLIAIITCAGCAERPAYTVTTPLDQTPRPSASETPSDPNSPDALNARAREYAKKINAAHRLPSNTAPTPKTPIKWSEVPDTPETAAPPAPAPTLTPVPPPPPSAPSIRDREFEQTPPSDSSPFPTIDVDEITASSPATSPDALSTEQLVKALIAKIESQGTFTSAKTPLQLAVMSLIDPSFEVTDEQLQHLSETERHLVIAYQMMFTELGTGLDGDSQATRDTLINAIEQLSEIIQDTKPLAIVNPTLCTSVESFGGFTPRGSNRFTPGPDNRVIVYMEIENFKPVMKSDGKYQVLLQLKAALLSTDGLTVWNETHDISDTSRNKRKDFYVPYIIDLNQNITLGKYILKLTITDLQGMHVDEVTIPIEYVAAKDLLTPTTPTASTATP